MLGPTDNSALHRVIVAVGAVLLLASVIGNLVSARRNVTLNIEQVGAANVLQESNYRLQQLNQAQQQITLIAQDLMNRAPQFPWLIPILQKYGLVHTQGGAQPAGPPALKEPTTRKTP